MSHWTHITSCISVDTGLTEKKKDLLKIVKQYLKDAPKITGSEGNADVFVNIQSGYTIWMNWDCAHCKYNTTIKWEENGWFTCESPENHKCKTGKYQPCIVISIQGDLRDRTKKQTQEEFESFLKYIKNKYDIRDYSLNISE